MKSLEKSGISFNKWEKLRESDKKITRIIGYEEKKKHYLNSKIQIFLKAGNLTVI